MYDYLSTQQNILKDVSKNWWKSKQYDFRFGKYHDILKEKDYVFVLYQTYAGVLIPEEKFVLNVENLKKVYGMTTVECSKTLMRDYELSSSKMELFIPTGIVMRKEIQQTKKPANLVEFKGDKNGTKKYVREDFFKILITKIDTQKMIFYSEPKDYSPLYLVNMFDEQEVEGIFMPVRIND